MSDYRQIPYFTRYAISKDGTVINWKTLRVQKIRLPYRGSPTVNLNDDKGNRTCRTIKELIRITWGQDDNTR